LSDPFEQWNRASSLTFIERSYLHNQLEHLKGCKGTWDCTVGSAKEAMPQIQQHQRYISKRKYNDAFGMFYKIFIYTSNTKNPINYFSRRYVCTLGVTNYTRKRTW